MSQAVHLDGHRVCGLLSEPSDDEIRAQIARIEADAEVRGVWWGAIGTLLTALGLFGIIALVAWWPR